MFTGQKRKTHPISMLSEAAEKLANKDQGVGLGTGVGGSLEEKIMALRSDMVALIQT